MVIAKPVAALLINLTIYQRLSAAAMMEMDLKDYTLQVTPQVSCLALPAFLLPGCE